MNKEAHDLCCEPCRNRDIRDETNCFRVCYGYDKEYAEIEAQLAKENEDVD